MRLQLDAVVDGRKSRPVSCPAADGCSDQFVAERGIFGKDRAMAVGTVNVEIAAALCAVCAVVAVAFEDVAERTDAAAEVCAAAVILESDNCTATG